MSTDEAAKWHNRYVDACTELAALREALARSSEENARLKRERDQDISDIWRLSAAVVTAERERAEARAVARTLRGKIAGRWSGPADPVAMFDALPWAKS
jgi:hypothetical protein